MSKERLEVWEGTNFVTDPTWGDNGKGKVVDVLATRADMVIRINGGNNAGHTVINEQGEFKLHLVPVGIFNPEAVSVIADTVVINPFFLVEEMEQLKAAGLKVEPENLLISSAAHLILPWHLERDKWRERLRGSDKIGTTGRGIGPAYADRTERTGLRLADLYSPEFVSLFDQELMYQQQLAKAMGETDWSYDRELILAHLTEAADYLAPFASNVLPVIWDYQDSNRRILGEAGQGVLLDLDRGSYPFVTSSHPGIAGFNLATGLNPAEMNRVIAVTKAYSTRVGEGPMPTELLGDDEKTGDQIRTQGREFGTTTGRPRRTGWLDLPAIRYGLRVGGANSLALTKLDILDGFPEVRLCIGYRVGNKDYVVMPTADPRFLAQAEPIYEILPGWEESSAGVTSFPGLPLRAREFIARVEALAEVPVELVSTGPHRDNTIYR